MLRVGITGLRLVEQRRQQGSRRERDLDGGHAGALRRRRMRGRLRPEADCERAEQNDGEPRRNRDAPADRDRRMVGQYALHDADYSSTGPFRSIGLYH